MEAKYKPEIFDQKSLDAAKYIIVTPENGIPTDARWSKEAEWFVERLENHINLKGKMVMDFGCGVGRLSQILTARGATVVGVDISSCMREHANTQGIGDSFAAVSPTLFDSLLKNGTQFDLAISVWVLQHCPNLDGDAGRIVRALKPGAGLFVMDMNHRAIPVEGGWYEDKKSVFNWLSEHLDLVKTYPYDLEGGPDNLQKNGWLGYFVKR